jgi:hypothetical protein
MEMHAGGIDLIDRFCGQVIIADVAKMVSSEPPSRIHARAHDRDCMRDRRRPFCFPVPFGTFLAAWTSRIREPRR